MRATAPQAGWSQGLQALHSRISSSLNQTRERLSARVLSDVPFVLMATVFALTMLGLVMVLSASSIQQISKDLPWSSQFVDQGRYTVMGLVIMLALGLWLPVTWVRSIKVLTLALLTVVALLIGVMVMGETVKGNRNWINLMGITVQPSELAKPVMILWLARVYSLQGSISTGTLAQSTYKALVPAALGFGLVVALILSGHDVGTVVVYFLFFTAIFMAAGPSRPLSIVYTVFSVVIGAYALLGSENRRTRFLNVLPFRGPCTDASCDQVNASMNALATGGFWGVGLGQSRQKYNYLPEAHNDFIFAIVGEELGMIGALAILMLYGMLIHCAMRIMLRSSDLFIKYASLGIITWFAGQGLLNIGMAVNIIPVIGVPLPFVSYGGSSMISSLVAMGLLIAFARQTPLQPIMGETSGTLQPSQSRGLMRRRVALLRQVQKEQASIAKNPYEQGMRLEGFQRLIGYIPSAPASQSAARPQRLPASDQARAPRPSLGTSRPSATTVRRAQQPARQEVMEAAVARRSSSTSGARPTRALQSQQNQARAQAPASNQGRGEAPASRPSTSSKAPMPKASTPQAPAAQPKLPEGLRTIRKARPLPPGNKGQN